MNLQEIRERAMAVGLIGVGKLRKAELIHKIQQAEGNDFLLRCRVASSMR